MIGILAAAAASSARIRSMESMLMAGSAGGLAGGGQGCGCGGRVCEGGGCAGDGGGSSGNGGRAGGAGGDGGIGGGDGHRPHATGQRSAMIQLATAVYTETPGSSQRPCAASSSHVTATPPLRTFVTMLSKQPAGRGPHSRQLVPKAHSAVSAPGPPSLHPTSPKAVQVSVQISAPDMCTVQYCQRAAVAGRRRGTRRKSGGKSGPPAQRAGFR
jgi:hypothetical protein